MRPWPVASGLPTAAGKVELPARQPFTAMTIGVLAYQGDFEKHQRMISALGVDARLVRNVAHLNAVDALILPGGESTTIGMLLERFGLLDAIRERLAGPFPILGTCAGAILLARDIEGSDQLRLGVLDMAVRRNAYGRQVFSFEATVQTPAASPLSDSNRPWQGVFIRAPQITRVGSDLSVLATFEGSPVVVQRGAVIAATFHPELTDDSRLHRFFVQQVAAALGPAAPSLDAPRAVVGH